MLARVGFDELTPLQRAAVDYRGGNLVVEAVPGSGKTRVIVARSLALMRDGVAPEEILVLTFSRRAVGELRGRFASVGAGARTPEIRTFHGFAARLLADAGEAGRSRRLLSEPAERVLFQSVVAATTLRSLPAGASSSALFATAAATRVAEIRRAPAAARAQLNAAATPRIADLLALDTRQTRERERLGLADFDDLIARAVRLAAEPTSRVARALAQQYRHVLIDEFQDTDPLQLALLACFRAELFGVGDAAQAIYGFRGAARDAMSSARTQLRMQQLTLGESFRCPRAICDLARAVWTPQRPLTSRADVAGEIAYRRAASPHDEAAFIGESIAAALARGIPAAEIVVLVRSAEPLAGLVESELRARGIAVTRQGGENVLDDLAVDAICAALDAFTTPWEVAAWIRLCSHPAFAIDPLALRLAFATQPPRGLDGACALLEALPAHARATGARLARALRSAHQFWSQDEPLRAARAFAHDSDLLGYVISGGEADARASAGRIATFLDGLGDVLDVRAKIGSDISAAAVYRAFRTASEGWRAEGEPSATDSGVAILTVHAAKGLEFSFVVVADAVDSHFPQAWRADPLVSRDEIAHARACGVDLGVLADEHENEERSLWYVAVTRAKHSLLVTWSERDLAGSPLRPSRFLPLAERSMEAARASYRGPLGFVPAPTLDDAQPPSAARLLRPLRTSTMEQWLTCRRKFYYTALLRIGSDERGFSAKLGTLVHRAVAAFHGAVADFRDVAEGAHIAWTTTLCELARAIAEADDFERFDSPLESEAALRAADRLLARYARHLENSAREEGGGFEVIATEKSTDYTVAGIAFSGRIDRIDRLHDGSLALVDVKTGKLADKGTMREAFPILATAAHDGALWTKKAYAGNPQLPLYRHAEAQTGTLAYLYLGAATKFGAFGDRATEDRLDLARDSAAIEAMDTVLHETFFAPWAAGAIATLEPTQNARTCRFCEFEPVCPGYREDDE